MDETRLHKNAGRVAAVFNALSVIIVIVGVLIAVGLLIVGFAGAGFSRQLDESGLAGSGGAQLATAAGGIVGAVITLIYTVIVWASVQLSALVAGYIKVRTAPRPAPPQGAYLPNP